MAISSLVNFMKRYKRSHIALRYSKLDQTIIKFKTEENQKENTVQRSFNLPTLVACKGKGILVTTQQGLCFVLILFSLKKERKEKSESPPTANALP